MIIQAETDAEKETLIEYLMLKIGVSKDNLVGKMPFEIYAVVRDGVGLGAILLTNFRGTSVEVCLAGNPGWITRRDLRLMLHHIFVQRGVLRAWGIIKRSNGDSRELAKRMGCREVGILENEYGQGVDGVLYSMTASKCRWLKAE